jgi:hypothetical protein
MKNESDGTARRQAQSRPAVPILAVESPTFEESQMNNVEEFNFNVSPDDHILQRKISVSLSITQPLVSNQNKN